MADTTDNMGLRIPSRDGSDTADLAKIIADLGEDVDGKLGVWQDYTPVLTASTTNPTGWIVTGRYARIGTTVHVQVRATAGESMTPGSGYYLASLPVPAATTSLEMAVGSGWAGTTDPPLGAALQVHLLSVSAFFPLAIFGELSLYGADLASADSILRASFTYEAAV